MNESLLIAMALNALSNLVISLVSAKGDKAKQEQALLAAEEDVARIRSKQKFG